MVKGLNIRKQKKRLKEVELFSLEERRYMRVKYLKVTHMEEGLVFIYLSLTGQNQDQRFKELEGNVEVIWSNPLILHEETAT